MKRRLLAGVIMLIATGSFAQSDTTETVDTVRVGNFIIIKKKKKGGHSDYEKVNITVSEEYKVERRPRNRKQVNTNWFIFDLGFANFRDKTDYATAAGGSFLKTLRPVDGPVTENSYKIINGKSSNVNFWFFMQKLSLINHVVNLKYGLGLEMYNYRYESRLSYRNDPQPYVFNDSIHFTKNKLYVQYLTVPFMVNFNTNPNRYKNFNFSVGISAGYLLSSKNKQISAERGKQKYNGNFNFEPWRFAAVGEIGLGPIRLYGSYSLNRLQTNTTRIEQYPYAVGIRLGTW